MNASHALKRNGEHAVRIMVAEILLHAEREFLQILEPHEVVGTDAGGKALRLVGSAVLEGVTNDLTHPNNLQLAQRVDRCGLDLFQLERIAGFQTCQKHRPKFLPVGVHPSSNC